MSAFKFFLYDENLNYLSQTANPMAIVVTIIVYTNVYNHLILIVSSETNRLRIDVKVSLHANAATNMMAPTINFFVLLPASSMK